MQALLSERITDCNVQDFFEKNDVYDEGTEDFLSLNYRQAATMVQGTKKLILKQLEELKNGDEKKMDNDVVNDLNELVNEADLCLARMLSKQGAINAKVDNYVNALVRG